MRVRWLLFALISLSGTVLAQGTSADYDRAMSLGKRYDGKALNLRVEPRWAADGKAVWYRAALPDGKGEYRSIDTATGIRRPAFDHAALGEALAKELKRPIRLDREELPELSILGDDTRFSLGDKSWKWNDTKKTLEPADKRRADTAPLRKDQPGREGGREPRSRGTTSPDGKLQTFVKDGNLWLRTLADKQEAALTTDGKPGDGYTDEVYWSRDSLRVVAVRLREGDKHPVTFVESSPRDQLQPKVQTHDYLKPGDKIPWRKPHLFDAVARKEIPVSDELFGNPWSIDDLRWQADSSRLLFHYNQRGHGILRVLAIDAATGKVSAVVDEVSKTFIDYAGKSYYRWLEKTGDIVWMSERDGWNHLYRIDAATGKVKNAITSGAWAVRSVESLDEDKGELTFWCGGIDPAQDPYHLHLCRVKLDGTGLVRMTRADGTHTVRFSPDRTTYVDSWSRVDLAPVHELHRTSDGSKIADIEATDLASLKAAGWRAPERFTAMGRDGKTPIYGIIHRPIGFDPAKKYPVIEQIYAGPHAAHVPKEFRVTHGPSAMAELGFVVVQIDGMGTSHRSKAFHDVCWKNLGDSGFPDRILWIKAAAAAKDPSMDISKVGIYGGSAGGQSAARALLAFGEFYKVAVADCGCHDNRMDKIWWNELWMSWPVGPHYAEQSNVTQAHKLTGKLLLVVGELDRNVDPASTMQVVNALIKANKDFDLLVIPGNGHGMNAYGQRRQMDYFVRHLHGVEPRR